MFEATEMNEQTFNEMTTWEIKTLLASLNQHWQPATSQTP